MSRSDLSHYCRSRSRCAALVAFNKLPFALRPPTPLVT